MSKAVSAKGNLVVARELKKHGFANLLEAQPDMKARFHSLWYDKKTLTESRKILLSEFPDGNVPSIQQLSVYAKKHLVGKPVSTVPGYVELMKKVDSIAIVYDGVQHLQKLAIKARDGNAKLETQRRIYDTLISRAATLIDLEGKLGFREVAMPGITVNNNTLNVGEQSEHTDEQIASIERLIELKRQLAADKANGRVIEGEAVSEPSESHLEREPDSI